jgi:TRAP-type C4-dicarboxylate transport system permease small subunit
MTDNDNDNRAHLSGGGWLALVVLAGFLVASIWISVQAWNSLGEVHMSTFGWVALIGGSLLTITVGGGLMALLFYSSRHNYDR